VQHCIWLLRKAAAVLDRRRHRQLCRRWSMLRRGKTWNLLQTVVATILPPCRLLPLGPGDSAVPLTEGAEESVALLRFLSHHAATTGRGA
jgi:hypothetical protein